MLRLCVPLELSSCYSGPDKERKFQWIGAFAVSTMARPHINSTGLSVLWDPEKPAMEYVFP